MKKLYALAAVLLLLGCVGTTKPATFYNLKAFSAGEINSVASRKISIGVSGVEIPAYADKPQIVIAQPDAVELKVSELNRWAEPLGGMMQRTLADDLAAYLPSAVVKSRSSIREKFDYVVAVEISKFSGTWGQKAELDAWWTVTNSAGDEVLRRRATLQQPLTSGYDAYVLAQSRLLSDLAGQIAEQLSKL